VIFLNGQRIVLLEARMTSEAAALVRRFGGIPHCVPAVREIVQPQEAGSFIDALVSGSFSVVVFLTGAGVAALLNEAAHLHCLETTLTALRLTKIACRGPKPVAVLRQHDVTADVVAAEPFTSKELLAAISAIDLDGKGVALVHYGEANATLAAALSARGAQLDELLLYEWKMPEDVEPLKALVRELIHGDFDAVAFTTQIQCRHLFRIAADLGLYKQLADALNKSAVVAAVGPVCADVLRVFGVTPDVVPQRPKLGPMMLALAGYFQRPESTL
jgi:uroporphyrinogen-III synthase